MSTQQNQPVEHPLVSVQLNAADLLGVVSVGVSALAALLFQRLRKAAQELQAFQRPNLFLPRDTARINQILSQLGILTGADRVILGIFHNGMLSVEGWHLSRLQCVAAYLSPGTQPISELYRIIPIEQIPELKQLMFSSKGFVSVDAKEPKLTAGCRMYLEVRNIRCLRNILLRAGEVETGIVSFHYVKDLTSCPTDAMYEREEVLQLIRELERMALLKNQHPSVLGFQHFQR